MSVQRGSIELSEDEYLVEARVETVTDRNIDESILPRERNCGLATISGQGTQTRAAPPSHDDTDNFSLFHKIRR